MQNATLELLEMHRWVATMLPVWNQECSERRLSPEEFASHIQQVIQELTTVLYAGGIIDRLDMWDARRCLQLLGFMVSSVERHFQSAGQVPGFALRSLGSTEQLLHVLSHIGKHPPKDSAYTYWIWNDTEPLLSFTADPQELIFHRVVAETDRLFTMSCHRLRSISDDLKLAEMRDIIDSTKFVTECIVQAYAQFASLMEYTDASRSRRKLEPHFFATTMRTYLVPYPVEGRMWPGVSAASIASQMGLDFLIGTVDESYVQHVRQRLGGLPEELSLQLQEDMNRESLTEILLKAFSIPTDSSLGVVNQQFSKSVRQYDEDLAQALLAYRHLVRAAARLSSLHWTLIVNYLVRETQHISQEELPHLTVDPHVGTSGMSMEDVRMIRDMRSQHPAVAKLIAHIPNS